MKEIIYFKELFIANKVQIFIIDCEKNNYLSSEFFIGEEIIIDNVVWTIKDIEQSNNDNTIGLIV